MRSSAESKGQGRIKYLRFEESKGRVDRCSVEGLLEFGEHEFMN